MGWNQSAGAAGEDVVANWYATHGYQLVARNWRCREGELDLVVLRGSEIVFCEVKTRTSDRFGLPVEAVGHRKQARLRVLAARFLSDRGRDGRKYARLRFDVASVVGTEVEIIEAAF